jgi:hypothetical protein
MLDKPPDAWLSPLNEWIQPQIAFDYWGSLRFRMSLWQAVLAVIAILALAVTAITAKKDSGEPAPGAWRGLYFNMALLAGITAGAMLLQLEVSRPFWTAVPLVRFIQFPWRLLGIASFCIALLAGFLFAGSVPHSLRGEVPHPRGERRLTRIAGWGAAAGFLALVLYAGVFKLTPQFYPYADPLNEDAVSLEGLSERGRSLFTIFSDFLPASVKVDPTDLANSRAAPDASLTPMTYVPAIEVTGDRPFRLDLRIRSDQPFTLRLHRFFFPGWQVTVAGEPVPTGPSGDAGLVTADLPSGEYPVVVLFGRTPLRGLADLITLISWIVWVAAGIAIRRARPILIAMGVVLTLSALLMVARHGAAQFLPLGEGEASGRPIPVTANFQDEIHLLGYQLPKGTWQPGDDLPLRLYWFAPRTPEADYKVFVHLVKADDDSARVAQSDSFPVLGYSPTTRWEPGEIITDDRTILLGEDIAPGKYLLLAGLYHPERVQNLPVSGSAQVLPGDRVVLTEIEVQAR